MLPCSAKLKQFIILYMWTKVTLRWKTSCGSDVSLNATQIAVVFLLFGSKCIFKKQRTEEKQSKYIVGYCLKSMGCWIWPVSC